MVWSISICGQATLLADQMWPQLSLVCLQGAPNTTTKRCWCESAWRRFKAGVGNLLYAEGHMPNFFHWEAWRKHSADMAFVDMLPWCKHSADMAFVNTLPWCKHRADMAFVDTLPWRKHSADMAFVDTLPGRKHSADMAFVNKLPWRKHSADMAFVDTLPWRKYGVYMFNRQLEIISKYTKKIIVTTRWPPKSPQHSGNEGFSGERVFLEWGQFPVMVSLPQSILGQFDWWQ